jgi:hypothetical protein
LDLAIGRFARDEVALVHPTRCHTVVFGCFKACAITGITTRAENAVIQPNGKINFCFVRSHTENKVLTTTGDPTRRRDFKNHLAIRGPFSKFVGRHRSGHLVREEESTSEITSRKRGKARFSGIAAREWLVVNFDDAQRQRVKTRSIVNADAFVKFNHRIHFGPAIVGVSRVGHRATIKKDFDAEKRSEPPTVVKGFDAELHEA